MLTQEIKDKYIERALMHQEADDFEKGYYWEGGKGCAVGCLSHDNYNPHQTLARDLQSPEWVFHCADTIFEGLSVEESKQWPVDFIKAMPIGLTDEQWDKQIKAPFMVLVLESTLETFDHDKYPNVKSALDQSTELWKREDIGSFKFKEEAEAAEAAARAAGAAAWAAAWAAAEAAARAAGAAAWAAAEAAEAAAWAAGAAEAEKYRYFADELIKLMKTAEND